MGIWTHIICEGYCGYRWLSQKQYTGHEVSFKGKKINAEVTTGGGAGITKQVKYLIDGEVLFSINSRYTGGTYRNFITTGELLRTFLSKA